MSKFLYELSPEYNTMRLVISRPFLPNSFTNRTPFSFFFVNPAQVDVAMVHEAIRCYPEPCYVEKSLYGALSLAAAFSEERVQCIPDFVTRKKEMCPPKIAFLASSDTHAHFLLMLQKHFPDSIFLVPDRKVKDEGAAKRLAEHHVAFHEVDLKQSSCAALEEFQPDILMCGVDWTDEFNHLRPICKGLDITTVSLQEGPQYWHMTRSNQYANKFRNSDILLAQGVVTLRNIHPKNFTITGNPKVDKITEHPLPAKPKLFINCNFTYNQWEEHRKQWMQDILELCKELNLDYLISKHPRDFSKWNDPNLVESNAFSVSAQIQQCSIVISRLSSLPYEALCHGRTSIYYNPHGEPIPTFCEDKTPGLLKAFNKEELRQLLAAHIQDSSFRRQDAEISLREHCGPPDGKSLDRIVSILAESCGGVPEKMPFLASHFWGITQEDIQNGGLTVCYTFKDRIPEDLIRSVQSLRKTCAIPFEVVCVDYGSASPVLRKLECLTAEHRITLLKMEAGGLPWNKSQCLNTAAQAAITDYIIFCDIDMVFAEDITPYILDIFKKGSVLHCTPMWVPKNKDFSKAAKGNHDQYGGFVFLEKAAWDTVGGYDEGFYYWGYEDIDFHNRLMLSGHSAIWMDNFKKMFHIWHPINYGLTEARPENALLVSGRRLINNILSNNFRIDNTEDRLPARRAFSTPPASEPPVVFQVKKNRFLAEWRDILNTIRDAKVRVARIDLDSRYPVRATITFSVFSWVLPMLQKVLARSGYRLAPSVNRNYEFFYQMLGVLRESGLQDYYVTNDFRSVYLLFSGE